MITKILCVDDDEMFGVLLQHIFKTTEGDYEVITKKSAQDGLNYLRKMGDFEFPRVIILDINMPSANGFDFLTKYREYGFEFQQTSIYLVSSTIFPEDQRKATEDSLVKNVFTKPFNRETADLILKDIFNVS
jgi:CheY-like chemotaxis protein